VLVDGAAVQKRHAVTAGERVVVQARAPSEVPASGPAPAAFAVVYEDDALIVVDKPAGVVVHPARGHEQGTLSQALAQRAAGGEDPYRAGIVHRLDRDTSGLLVVAKSDPVHRRLKALLQARDVRREYLALVDGTAPARTGTIDAPIGRDRRDRLIQSLDTGSPREARTHFELVEALAADALLRVTLETGRTHQIRVHLAHIGHPLLGDSVYGGGFKTKANKLDAASQGALAALNRQALHAQTLGFEHPVTSEQLHLQRPPPQDFLNLASALRV
jgi:23S rRNA pseudouridine1911/1915/1917 synthase